MKQTAFTALLLALILSSCNSGSNNRVRPSDRAVSQSTIEKLDTIVRTNVFANKDLSQVTGQENFVSFVKVEKLDEMVERIEQVGGHVLSSSTKTGYINFTMSPFEAKKIINDKDFKYVGFNEVGFKDFPEVKVSDKKLNSMIPNSVYPTEMMNVQELKKQFADQGIVLDGSSSTVVVADTGLDIGRTDVFQDRIVGLHPLRLDDFAHVVEADVVEENGVKYLVGDLKGMKIKIEKTARLDPERKYYVGYFSEKQFTQTAYQNYDFNQDGLDTAIFPVVAFKNPAGIFQAYINTNSKLTYGEQGDDSIEDENVLLDFNYVARNVRDRFIKNKKDPSLSYYRFTTRLDVGKLDASGKYTMTTDRKKGYVNVAINIRDGFELDAKGDLIPRSFLKQGGQTYYNYFVPYNPQSGEKPIYRIGISGFDLSGHGTHCSGIATGNFEKVKQFTSAVPKAKLIGVSYIGGRTDNNDFYHMIEDVIAHHKNVVFSFSFGSNSPVNLFSNYVEQSFEDKVKAGQGNLNYVDRSAITDFFAKNYGIAFMKAAGNEGPGLKSHGNGTSQLTIDVANYYSSNSRNMHATDATVFADNKFYPADSTSHGPMMDGALKPDIGAPGYVMSVIPFRTEVSRGGSGRAGFGYWPGTSMATPNAASVVALLYDAAEKIGLNDHTSTVNPFSIDKLHKALKNSAIKYSTVTRGECHVGMHDKGACKLKVEKHDFDWLEAGAGRINATGAWKVLTEVIDDLPMIVTTNTPSEIPGYEGFNIGFFTFDYVPSEATFWINLNRTNSLEDLSNIHSYRLVANSDFVYFDPGLTQQVKVVEIPSGLQQNVKIYFDRQKIMENGRVKAGVHADVIKAYNLNNDKYFEWTFPVTVVGMDSKFDRTVDGSALAARGFIPAGQYKTYFLSVDKDQSTMVVDLSTSMSAPGSVYLKVYKDGIEFPYEKLGTNNMLASSSNQGNFGANNTRYVLQNLDKGVYELAVVHYGDSVYEFKDEWGSYFDITVNRLQLNVNDVKIAESKNHVSVKMEGVSSDRYMLIPAANVITTGLKKESVVEVKHGEQYVETITIPEFADSVIIKTEYPGLDVKTDIDMVLMNEDGQPITSSGNQGSNEMMAFKTKGLNPGNYVIGLVGYDIPQGTESFNLTVQYNLRTPKLMTSTFKDVELDKVFGLDNGRASYLKADKVYNFSTSFSKAEMSELPVLDGFKYVYTLQVQAMFGNAGDRTVVYQEEL